MMNGCHVKPEQFFNLIFGYYDRWVEDLGFTATATTQGKNSTAVPAGEVWVLEMASMRNTSAAGSGFAIDIYLGVAYGLRGVRTLTVAQYDPVVLRGPITLKEGDYIQFTCSGISVGNSLIGGCWGYKMKVA